MIQAPKLKPRIMRYELTDGEWATIKPMLPNKPRGVPRVNDRCPQWNPLGLAVWSAMARPAGQLRPIHNLLQSVRPLATSGGLDQDYEHTSRCS